MTLIQLNSHDYKCTLLDGGLNILSTVIHNLSLLACVGHVSSSSLAQVSFSATRLEM